MLKIKDDVDLKELEKFGLKYVEEGKGNPEMYEWIRETTDKFDYVDVYIWNRKINVSDANDVLYDLIKAGLVEKVDDK